MSASEGTSGAAHPSPPHDRVDADRQPEDLDDERGQVEVEHQRDEYEDCTQRVQQGVAEVAHLEPIEAPSLRREADLRGALDRSSETPGEEGGPDEAPAAAEESIEDYQLGRAIDLLQGLALFQERAMN